MVLRDPVWIAYAVAALASIAVGLVTWRRRTHNPTVAIALTRGVLRRPSGGRRRGRARVCGPGPTPVRP